MSIGRALRPPVLLAREVSLVAQSHLEEDQEQGCAEAALARFLFSRLSAAEVKGFTATLDQLVSRLGDPGFRRMRDAELERWRAVVAPR